MTEKSLRARPALARKENAQRDGLGADVSTNRTSAKNSKSIAILPDCRSPVTETSRVSFAELAAMLATPRLGGKDGPAWMPAEIDVGPRNGERVKSISFLALDVEADAEPVKDENDKPLLDKHGDSIKRVIGSEPPSIDEMLAELALTGWRCILHTTYSHGGAILPEGIEHPRYRLIFDLSRPLAPAELRPLGLHVAALLGLSDCFDAKALEPARLFYLPRCPEIDRQRMFRHEVVAGEPLDVDKLLADAAQVEAARKAAMARRRPPASASVIETFNAQADIGRILEEHGYAPKGRRRWLFPGSTTGLPGVRLLPVDGRGERVYSSHGGDPLNDGHAHDAFDIWRILKHGGDLTAAVKDAARLLGLERPGAARADAAVVGHRPAQEIAAAGDAGAPADDGDTGPEQADSSPFPPESERPCYQVLDDWADWQGRKWRPGVYYCWAEKPKGAADGAAPDLYQEWFCSPLHVDAITFDAQDNNFGRLLRFKNSLGKWRSWAMPMELLRGSGEELRGELLAMGTEFDLYKARQQLPAYLQRERPKRRMRCAMQTGWAGQSFVLPDEVIGPDAAGVIFQSGERGHDEYTKAGTLEGWKEGIGAKASGNPLLLLALSAGFAGPMLARCNAEGGGIHFVGDSSTGKTTVIEAAGSIWGGPNYRRSWRATANGLEGAAALFNDCLLALDEISECDPKEVGMITYALGNGRGKQRASRTGTARSVVRWRCIVLSSGERTIGTTMAEGGHRAKAGQSVRLLDVPVARAYGAWDTLHGAPTGAAYADAIKRAAAAHHGIVGRAFLEKLTHDTRDFCAMLEEVKALPMFAAEGGEGQDKRAAGRFALIGLSGELATEYGLTGWQEGEAIGAAALAFDLWRSLRGRGNDERRQIAERLAGFLERHGDGRFSDADATGEVQIRDRAGWWRDTHEGREYLMTAEAMREALRGFDFARALDALQALGALPKPGSDGKRARFFRIGGRGMRLYPINPDKLAEGDHGA